MPKTHPYLKGLVETRARAAGNIRRLFQTQKDLSVRMARLQQQLRMSEQRLLLVNKQLSLSQDELLACDQLILKVNAQCSPERIEPIQAWKGRYGKRGQLRITIVQTLKKAYPRALSSFELEWELLAVFRLEFPSPQARNSWFQNSLRGTLKVLTQSGDVERLHKAEKNAARKGRWRWKPPAGAQTLGELSALAEAAGIGTQQAPDDEPEEP